MKPHARVDPISVGRVCMVCGRGQRPRLGGLFAASPVLQALGYEWDRTRFIGFAHVPCVNRAKKVAK